MLARSQGLVREMGIPLKTLRQLLTPDLGMMDVRSRVQSEIAAGLLIGAVHLPKAAGFLERDSRNLGFIRVESS